MTQSGEDGQDDRRDQQGDQSAEEDLASTSNDSTVTGNDRNPRGPAPQGGKGTPSQAEGDRDDG